MTLPECEEFNTKDGCMQNFFNYTTFVTKLEKTTRTLFITLNRSDWDNAFRLEMLFELESLFAWALNKVEIHSICIKSSTPFFSTGLDIKNLKHKSASLLEKVNFKLQKIITTMMQLPQTVIIDINEGCETLASEFCLGADIRICSKKAKVAFNHHHYGLIPAAGGMALLNRLTSPLFAKSWIFSGKTIPLKELESSGLISESYHEDEREQVLQRILLSVSKSAPVARIQSKLAYYEYHQNELKNDFIKDKKISKASMISEDWKSKDYTPLYHENNEMNHNFMPAKSMSYSVKLSLIKGEAMKEH